MQWVRLLLLAALAPAAVRARASFTSNLEYARVDGERLLLDASIPDGPGPFPAVIVVHGGGWVGGSKTMFVTPMLKPLSAGGFAWFSINYRLAPRHRYPACIEDLDTAIRWVKAHAAQERIDPRRIALLGESAGGYLVDQAAVRATDETRVAAVVAFYAPCDLLAQARYRGALGVTMVGLFGLNVFNDSAAKTLHDGSPLNYVHAGMPPFLLLHGTADKTVPYPQSVEWQARLKKLGVPCQLITIPGAPHGMSGWDKFDPAFPAKVVTWLRIHLGPVAVANAAPSGPSP
jgi:alpha-L-fucosidase 2